MHTACPAFSQTGYTSLCDGTTFFGYCDTATSCTSGYSGTPDPSFVHLRCASDAAWFRAGGGYAPVMVGCMLSKSPGVMHGIQLIGHEVHGKGRNHIVVFLF